MLEINGADIGTRNNENNGTTSKKKTPQKRSFSSYFKNLEKEGLIKLNPEVYNKNTKEMHAEGYFVVCAPCEKCRNKSDGMVKLRRQHYECYFKDQHCMTETHKACMRMLEDSKKTKSQKKVKSYSQSMLHIFFHQHLINIKHQTKMQKLYLQLKMIIT